MLTARPTGWKRPRRAARRARPAPPDEQTWRATSRAEDGALWIAGTASSARRARRPVQFRIECSRPSGSAHLQLQLLPAPLRSSSGPLHASAAARQPHRARLAPMAAPADTRFARQRFLYLGFACGVLTLVVVMRHRAPADPAAAGVTSADIAFRLKVRARALDSSSPRRERHAAPWQAGAGCAAHPAPGTFLRAAPCAARTRPAALPDACHGASCRVLRCDRVCACPGPWRSCAEARRFWSARCARAVLPGGLHLRLPVPRGRRAHRRAQDAAADRPRPVRRLRFCFTQPYPRPLCAHPFRR